MTHLMRPPAAGGQRTLISAINHLREHHTRNPRVFNVRDIKELETLTNTLHWLMDEQRRSLLSDAHYQAFDRVRGSLARLNKKWRDHEYQLKSNTPETADHHTTAQYIWRTQHDGQIVTSFL